MVDHTNVSPLQALFSKMEGELQNVIKEQDEAIRNILYTFFAGGHVLLEGVPGLGKTLLCKMLSQLIGGSFKRIQFTPDLMPSDIVGTTIFSMKSNAFQVKKGPVFANLILADEINRSPAKTQSALLQAMQEKTVTIDGEDFNLGDYFMCLATQNPIELEGTFPLPEAQVDRFLMKIILDYPSKAGEEDILRGYRDGVLKNDWDSIELPQLIDASGFAKIRQSIDQVNVDDKIISYITEIVRQTRDYPGIEVGASPRGSVALLQVSKVVAFFEGRDFVIPDDVKQVVYPVLRHRIILEPEAEIEGLASDLFLEKIVQSVTVPR